MSRFEKYVRNRIAGICGAKKEKGVFKKRLRINKNQMGESKSS